MVVLEGKGISEGIAIGRISFYRKKDITVKKYHIDDIDKEIARFYSALEVAVEELEVLYARTEEMLGSKEAEVFAAYQMLLQDPEYLEAVTQVIRRQRQNAEYAVKLVEDDLVCKFADMPDSYMSECVRDIKDISMRLERVLLAKDHEDIETQEPVIVAAEDILPSDMVRFDKAGVLAVVTSKGSVHSHTSIIARAMGIPAIVSVGEELLDLFEQKTGIVDGFSGKIYIEPDEDTFQALEQKKNAYQRDKEELNVWRRKDTITLDGKKVLLNANICNAEDCDLVLLNKGDGIGLYRSEFLYFNGTDYPAEEKQVQEYKNIIEKMEGHPVVIRTLDIGGDKQLSYAPFFENEVPFWLENLEVFKTQLRAILKASVLGQVRVMIPMIRSLEEVVRAKELFSQTKEELKKEGILFDDHMPMGIMIETVEAVTICNELVKEVDFFSIGTNDLGRNGGKDLDILSVIEEVVRTAHAQGVRVSICGELASDISWTERLLKADVDEFSVSPERILPVRKKICETTL